MGSLKKDKCSVQRKGGGGGKEGGKKVSKTGKRKLSLTISRTRLALAIVAMVVARKQRGIDVNQVGDGST